MSPPVTPTRTRTLNFAFTGNASEYFGIWIVNTLLRLITLGIYSPWAKVRKRQYFYANTILDNSHFEYLADPVAILKGWLIAIGAFGLYSILSNVSPTIGGLLGIILFLTMPWAVVRSRLFNMRYSSHRNVRFNFKPDYQNAYAVFVGFPFLTFFTLGLIIPYTLYRQKKFLTENTRFGTTPFKFSATPKEFYMVFLKAFGGIIVIIIVMGAGISFLSTHSPPIAGIAFLFPLLFVIIYFLLALYLYTSITNLTWNSTQINGNRFRSDLRVCELAWLYTSNTVAAFLSLGLLIPWGAIRLAHYRCKKLSLNESSNLDSFIADNNIETSATGEEFGDVFGLEIGL